MTIQTSIDFQIGETSEPQCSRWPAHMAKQMADTIHGNVRSTLRQSRLLPQGDSIRLVDKHDIVSIERVLGSGSFSQVSSVLCRDGSRYACKHLHKKLMEKPDQFRLAATELSCEAHMLSSFNHPNIVKIRGWSRNGVASFEEGYHDSFFLLLDVLDETLENRIDHWRLQEMVHPSDQSLYFEKLHIMSQVASALSYLHERGVIYRDLKPNNIGFLGNTVQLFDFGLSRELPSLDPSTPFEMSGKVGTLRYMANEVAKHQPYNLSADVFSFAMVSYEMLSLQKPFDGWTRDMHSSLVCDRGVRPDTINCICSIPVEMRLLLERAWNAVPAHRPTIDQVSSQIGILMEHQLMIFESQKMQMQLVQQMEVERQFEAERQAREDAAACILNIDLSLHLAQLASPKLTRTMSTDSIETIDTVSLSVDSIRF